MNTKPFEIKNSIYYEYQTAEICLEENQKYKSDPLIGGFVTHVRNKIREEYDSKQCRYAVCFYGQHICTVFEIGFCHHNF